MGHPFGDLISQHLHRKHGLSQSKLAAGILQAPTVITGMCKGRRLTGPQARQRVIAIIQWLYQQKTLESAEEANTLLAAAGMAPLHNQTPAEATLLRQLQGQAAARSAKPPPLTLDEGSATPRHNLPVQTTTFVGREREQEQLATLLTDPHCRLVTLVGPGGVGKSRLALQAVAAQLARYPHGAWFVALAPLLSADLVAATCLEALNLGQQPHLSPEEQLLHYLRRRRLLLVLDNLEHLPQAVGLIKAILSGAPGVNVLVTSRERLKLQEEWVLNINGLAIPPASLSPLHLQQWSAVQLFVERARRLQPAFALTDGNAAAIAQICRRVDGIPLAIELAAGWSRLLPPPAIAQAIIQDFGFLNSAWQDLPERHQSLTAVFAHSWRLLTTAEQRVLGQLIVFRGDFRTEAAQAVAGASLALLGELVDKSWLRVSDTGRFDLHELVRQFIVWQHGLGRNSGQPTTQAEPLEEAAFARHCHYFGTFLQRQEPFLHGPRQQEVLSDLLAEVENIRQGWHWAVTHLEVEEIGRYLKSWQWLGEVRSWNTEMARLFGEAAEHLKAWLISATTDTSNDTIVQVKLTLAYTLYCQGRSVYGLEVPIEVETLCQESLRWWPPEEQTKQFSQERNRVKILLGFALVEQGRYIESESICRLVQQECVESNDQIGLYEIFHTLGFNAYLQGRFIEAQRWFEQSIAVSTQLGERILKFSVLSMLAEIVANQGNYALAKQYAWEVHQDAEAFGSTWFMICSYTTLGYTAFLTRQMDQANHYFGKGANLSEEIGAKFLYLNCKKWMGSIAYHQQDYATA